MACDEVRRSVDEMPVDVMTPQIQRLLRRQVGATADHYSPQLSVNTAPDCSFAGNAIHPLSTTIVALPQRDPIRLNTGPPTPCAVADTECEWLCTAQPGARLRSPALSQQSGRRRISAGALQPQPGEDVPRVISSRHSTCTTKPNRRHRWTFRQVRNLVLASTNDTSLHHPHSQQRSLHPASAPMDKR